MRSLFGAGESQDEVVAKLEKLKSSIKLVKELFRDKQVRVGAEAGGGRVVGEGGRGRVRSCG